MSLSSMKSSSIYHSMCESFTPENLARDIALEEGKESLRLLGTLMPSRVFK